MNRQLLPYVNFLLEHEPSPFCDYILSKELLASGDDTVLDAYDWARRFPLYTELLQEQLPDGSWYGFCDAVTELTKRRKYKTTARAMLRMRDLSLPLSDPMLVKTLALCREYLSGKTLPLELQRKQRPHSIQIELAKREVCRSLSFFSPEDQHVLPFRNAAAEHFRRVCSAGPFDYDTWVQTDSDPTVGTFSYDASIYLLSYRDTLSQQEQRLLLSYEWKRTHFGDVRPSDPLPPEHPRFVFFLHMLEDLQNFDLFGEFMADQLTPYLFGLCEKLMDSTVSTPIFINRYFAGVGQYSASWNSKQAKIRDLLLRIIRILNHCTA